MVKFILFTEKGKFQGLHESQRKGYFKVFRVLGKVSHKIQGFQGPLDVFQCSRRPLDTLHL